MSIAETNNKISETITEMVKTRADINLSNLTSKGNERLLGDAEPQVFEAQKGFITSNVLTDPHGYSELCKNVRSTFDLSKFEMVNNPNITEDGIVLTSELGKTPFNNMIKIPSWDMSKPWQFEIETQCTNNKGYEDGVTYSSYVLVGRGTMFEWWRNARWEYGTLRCYQANGTYFDFSIKTHFEELPHTKLVLSFDGVSSYTAKQFINGALTESKVLQGKQVLKSGQLYCTPSIFAETDLKTLRITVDGKEFFNGAKTGMDVIKEDNYTVVGSPEISEDGIITNSHRVGKCACAPYVTLSGNFEVHFAFTYKGNGSVQGLFGTCGNTLTEATGRGLQFTVNSENYLCAWHYINPTEYPAITVPLKDGVYYRFIYKQVDNRNGTFTQTLYKSENNGELTEYTTRNYGDVYNDESDYMLMGASHHAANPNSLEFDLNAFKVYVDGKLVYQPCLKIPYTLTKTGSKVVPGYARGRVEQLYEENGEALYWTLDEENENYTLPKGEIYGMLQNNQGKGLPLLSTFQSTAPVTDKCYHLMDGALLSSAGDYAEVFSKLKALKNTNPEMFTTEEEWQTSVGQYGTCSKWVLNDSTFRIPKKEMKRELVKAWKEGTDWYNIYSDGWCEQGGYSPQADVSIYPKNPYIDASYNITLGKRFDSTTNSREPNIVTVNADSFYVSGTFNNTDASDCCFYWETKGFTVVSDNIIPEYNYVVLTTVNNEKVEIKTKNELTTLNPYSLFDSKYSGHTLNNACWYKGGSVLPKNQFKSQFEALEVELNTEVVKGTAVTLPSGGSYTKKGDLPVKLSTDADITLYDFVVNKTDNTFTLPTLDGTECLVDYRTAVETSGSTWHKVNRRKFVVAIGSDPYTENYRAHVSPDGGTTLYTVGFRYDDVNGNTQDTSFTFNVPAGWYYRCNSDNSANYYEYDLVGYGNLYFYLGETATGINEINFGAVTEIIGRQPILIDSYVNGTSWYRVYSDGWCEQGGIVDGITNGDKPITFLKPYKDSNYAIQNSMIYVQGTKDVWGYADAIVESTKTPNGFCLYINNSVWGRLQWEAKGYIK